MWRMGRVNYRRTVWSATPVYANDTVYLGTPFYRIIALDPATRGEETLDLQQRVHARGAHATGAQKPRRCLLGERAGRNLRKAGVSRHDGPPNCMRSMPTLEHGAKHSEREEF